MVLSKELRPVQSKKLYEEKSKEIRKNVSLGAGYLSLKLRSGKFTFSTKAKTEPLPLLCLLL